MSIAREDHPGGRPGDRFLLDMTWWSALGGGVLWLVRLALIRPNPFDPEWAVALFLLSPLCLVPLALRLSVARHNGRLSLPLTIAVVIQPFGAVVLLLAFQIPRGMIAAAATLPWLLVTGMIALHGLACFRWHRMSNVYEICIDAGLVFLSIGGVWATISRLGLRPLGFKDIIVLLTAIHFHYAGLVLPMLTGLAGRVTETLIARAACGCVIAGVPMVAAGITATQLGLGSILECAAAWITAVGGLLSAWLHVQLATCTQETTLVRLLWAIEGLSLAISMGAGRNVWSEGIRGRVVAGHTVDACDPWNGERNRVCTCRDARLVICCANDIHYLR